MIWLAVSDVHNAQTKLQRLIEQETLAQGLLFAGDGLTSALKYKDNFNEFYAVPGNCDFAFGEQHEKLILYHGKRIFLCHGHRYRVKYEMLSLLYRCKEQEADICVFGHTHSPMVNWKDGILFVNPGALLNGSYAIIEQKEDGYINATIKQLRR
ncbi:MAG: YfcE family phosphodiesterase [Eubacteriales bacterium]|nr:YfcE family phosphodiesterase [Eubacteriales bacterium]